MFYLLKSYVPVWCFEFRHRVVPICRFGTIQTAPGQVRCQFCYGNTINLMLKDMVCPFLQIRIQRFQAFQQPFCYLPQENAALTGGVNEFKIARLDALRSHKKGRKKTLSQSKTPKIENQVHQPMVDVSVEHVQELEDENLKLRIENAFLKETRRLRLEDEAKMREL